MAESQESGRPRTAILEAAIGLFGKRGYNGTTMRDIAHQVGVLPGSLYAHISSKETLLDEIVELGIDSFLAIEASLPSNQPVLQRLRLAIKAHVRLAAENPGRSLVVFHQWRFLTGQNLNRAINKRRRYQQLFVKLVDEGIADGTLAPAVDSKIAVFTILGALNWVPEWYSPTGHYSPPEIGDRLADLLLDGLIPHGGVSARRR
jgi:AcrR family transcriptional regulator